ncbi:TonB-dependent receptor [Arenicella sp. 4NH20-0111]|uniref:TonB-dependent receptor n=1 Tax=Arenicella sp. 4NH20-0111 TaxID=3127648 RepID=UPI00310429F9
MKISFRKLAIAAAVSAVVAPTTGIAQDGETVFEEIVVTATKRAATLQDIPIAVSVTSAETIEQAQILDISDLQSVVPTLRVSQLQSSTNTNFSIRGFGNGANNAGIEPSVGVFIDGVYRSRSAGAISDLPNLERVEVLSGPQSTLFGKNASAGVISVVTKKPSGESGGRVSATVGNYSQLVLKGYYEGAFSDTAAFSIAASNNERDGYATNLVTGQDMNNRDRQSVRGQLLLNPSDTTEIRFIADFDTIDERCCFAANLVAGPTVAAIQAVGGNIVPNDPEALTFFSNVDSTNEQDNAGLSMQIDKEFENVQLTSITSIRDLDTFFFIDTDFTSGDLASNSTDSQIETLTQEIRFTSTNGDKLDWMIGGFFFDESVESQDTLTWGNGFRGYADVLSAAAGAPGAIGSIEAALGLPSGSFYRPGDGTIENSTLDNQAISLFGQLDFNITDSLTATVGLNYTKDEKDVTIAQPKTDLFGSVDLIALGRGLIIQSLAAQGIPVATAAQIAAGVPADQTPLAGLRALQFQTPFVDFPNSVESGSTDDDELTYNVRLSYDLSDSVNVYGGVSTGFKATSWNLSRDSRPFASDIGRITSAGLGVPNLISGTRFASPEEATVYEIGLKAKFDRFAVNVALFDQSIEGFQSNAFVGTGFNLANAGEQSTKGVEFDLTYYPTESLELKLAGTLLDSTYDSFEGAGRDPLTGAVVDLTGEDPAGITDTSLSASANYRFQLGNNDAYVRADFFYEDDTPIGDLAIRQFTRSSENLNIAAGVRTQNDWGFSLWVRNATDHTSLISAFASVAQSGSFTGYRTAPRSYGVTVTKDF